MKSLRIIIMLQALLALQGCASWTGMDAASKFSCAAPEGVPCMSMTGVDANIKAGNLGRYREIGFEGKEGSAPSDDAGAMQGAVATPMMPPSAIASPAEMTPLQSGDPVFIPPRRLRVWLAPFTDSTGRLHDQRLLYTVVSQGRWAVDSLNEQVMGAVPNRTFRLAEQKTVDKPSGNEPANDPARQIQAKP